MLQNRARTLLKSKNMLRFYLEKIQRFRNKNSIDEITSLVLPCQKKKYSVNEALGVIEKSISKVFQLKMEKKFMKRSR